MVTKKNPLLDEVFLQELYQNRHKEIYAKIIALDKDENSIEQIEGQVTGGSMSLDGTSNVRRSCNLTVVTPNIDINAYYWGFKSKFRLFIGLNNTINSVYGDIVWFPMGTFVITGFSTSYSANSYTISISGKDKMCLLNGELGGSVFATIDFGKEEVYNTETKITSINDIPIKTIIREAVHEYAGEPWDNIIINDLDDYGLELLDYKGTSPLYLILRENGSNEDLGDTAQITLDKNFIVLLDGSPIAISDVPVYNPRNNLSVRDDDLEPTIVTIPDDATNSEYTVAKVEYDQTCGYRYTDITYVGDLICNTGEAITSMLDKLVSMLGNWEYFYDVDGRFIFQRKPTYLDKTWNTIKTNNDNSYVPTAGETYVESAMWSSAVSWSFTDGELVTSFNNTPALNNVKNDYSIWGTRKSITGAELPVHLRYAIDKKPCFYRTIDGRVFLTQDEADYYTAIQQEGTFYKSVNENGLNNKWWNVLEWARYYAICQALSQGYTLSDIMQLTDSELQAWYPPGRLGDYIRRDVVLPTNDEITGETGLTPVYQSLTGIGMIIVGAIAQGTSNATTNTYTFDNVEDKPGQFSTHGSSCVHHYKWFIRLSEEFGYDAYVYDPIIPYAELLDPAVQDNVTILDLSTVIVCDWREIIFQMAKDYRKYGHYTPYDPNDGQEHPFSNEELLAIAENFNVTIRKNNGKDRSGEWYYPTGKTGYEQYYTDLEGFWRQLYCPPALLDKWYETGVWTDRDTSGGWSQGDSQFHPTWDDIGTNPAQISSKAGSNAVTIVLDNAAKTNITYFMSTNWVAEGDASSSGWNKQIIDSPASLNFWFDFLSPDEDSDFARYSVPAIGDRAKSVNDNNVKAIYFREIPNTIFTEDIQNIERKSGYTYMQYQPTMGRLFNVSTQGKCAMDVLEEWLNNYIYAIESVNMSTVPIYHLQPNTRIKVMDMNSKINGDYIVSRLSIPLTYNGTMSITATKVADRVY